MVDVAENYEKEPVYSIWSTSSRGANVFKTMFLDFELEPVISRNEATYQLSFSFHLGKISEIVMKNLKNSEQIKVNGNVLNHFMKLPKTKDEQFEKRKKEILSGNSNLTVKKRFIVDCLRYLD